MPLFAAKCARWPFTKKRAQRLDRAQFRMIWKILALPKESHETPDMYRMRAGRLVSGHVKRLGSWSDLWATLVLNWSDHLRRPANRGSFAAQLYGIQDVSWLLQRARFVCFTRSLSAGRTGTRATNCAPKARWEESLDVAIEWLHRPNR